jgi:hypothetical protein
MILTHSLLVGEACLRLSLLVVPPPAHPSSGGGAGSGCRGNSSALSAGLKGVAPGKRARRWPGRSSWSSNPSLDLDGGICAPSLLPLLRLLVDLRRFKIRSVTSTVKSVTKARAPMTRPATAPPARGCDCPGPCTPEGEPLPLPLLLSPLAFPVVELGLP